MDWKVFATAFVTIFLAELGDKTQLATMSLAAGSGSRLSVFAGAALALLAASAAGVIAGAFLGRSFPEQWIRRAAGVAFIAIGAWMLLRPVTS